MRNSTFSFKSILMLLVFVSTGLSNLDAAAFDVKFVRLHVAQVSDNVVVRWVTDSEYNNDFFTVQRTTDGGMSWKDLGIVPGSGTTPGAGSYEFWDQAPVFGNIAYRIKQTDADGTYAYSWKVDITITPLLPENPVQVVAYPNPTEDNIINVEGEYDEVELMDITGKLVALNIDNSGYSIRLSPIQKISGMYFLVLKKEDKVTVEKIQFN